MRLYRKKAALLQYLNEKKTSLGFVPTMGALHQGHLSLVEKAVVENNLVVVSIFVNPAQFKNQTDLENYLWLLKQRKQVLQLLEQLPQT